MLDMEQNVPYNNSMRDYSLIIQKEGRKMFCPKCGKEINDDAAVCIHCGRSLEEKKENKPEYRESKTAIGVVMGLFLGLIGLLIGMCMYPADTNARKTFVKAWGITFGVSMAAGVILGIILYFTVLSSLASFAPYM